LSSPFALPLAFTSWAFNKTNGVPVDRDAVYNMTRAAKRMGAKTIAVQIGEGITADDVAGLQRALFVVGWCVCDQTTATAVAELGVDGFMPQIEGDGQYGSAYAALQTGAGEGLPKAIVSDYGGLGSKERCDALRKLGAETLFVEAYASSGPQHADLPHYVTELAEPYGYDADHAIPTMGTFRNEFPSSYAGVERYGPGFGVYLLEPMSGAQLDAFAELAKLPPTSPGGPPVTVPTPPTVPPTDSQARAGMRAHAQGWESQQPAYQPRARITVARRIVDDSNTNMRWTAIRDEIVALLDKAGIAK